LILSQNFIFLSIFHLELMEASLPQKYSKIRTTSRKPTKQASKTKLNKLFAQYQGTWC
jgi:hypothetical protein